MFAPSSPNYIVRLDDEIKTKGKKLGERPLTMCTGREEGLPGQDLGGCEEVSVTVSPTGSFPTLDPAVSRGGCKPVTPLLIVRTAVRSSSQDLI